MKTLRDYGLSPGTSFPCMEPSEGQQSVFKSGVQVEGSGCFRTGTMGKCLRTANMKNKAEQKCRELKGVTRG